MTISSLLLITVMGSMQTPPVLPGFYPFNSGWHDKHGAWIDRVVLAEFVTRQPIELKVQRKTIPDSAGVRKTYLDVWNVLSDHGGSLDVPEQVRVAVSAIGSPHPSPLSGTTYLVAWKTARGGVVPFFAKPSSVGEPDVYVQVEDDMVSGMLCFPAETVHRSQSREGTEDRLGTVMLSIVGTLGAAKTAQDYVWQLDLIERLRLTAYRDPQRVAPDIAGQKAADWIRDHFWPRLDEAIKGKPIQVKLEPFAMLAAFPGAKSAEYGRELFEYVLKQIHATGQIPNARYWIAGHQYVDADRIIAEADRMPWNVRKSFIGSLSRPLSERSVATLISWLDKADGSLAYFLLDKLARWAKRKDLEPQIAEKYKDGHPVILNRENLTQIWQKNPPPLTRRGG